MPEYNDPQQNILKPDNKPAKKGKTEIVKDVISKGRTATGNKPDEIILNPVLEAKERKAVFAFGRFNPPTIGHEKLIHKVEDTAKSQGAEAHIIASHTEGNAKNPLPKEKKVEYLKKIAGEGTNVSSSSSEHPTLLHHLSRLHKSGVQHITMVAGDDRVKEFHSLINKYNGKEGPHSYFNFKSIKVVSAGHRDPDAEGAEGMSGTKARSLARAGDIKGLKKGLPKALHPHAEEIANHIKSIKEDIDNEFGSFIVESLVEEIGSIYDQVIAEENINYDETKFREDGSDSVVTLSKHVTPGEPKSSKVVGNNTAPAPAKITKPNTSVKEATDSEFNKRFGKYREAVPRSGQDRKEIDLVPRDDADRKESDKPYRQQSIQKKIVDEGKKLSPWEKMVRALPKLKDSEERAQAAKARLQQAGKDYQAILDKEKNESVNSAGSGGIRGFGNVSGNPDGDSEGYVDKNADDADTRNNIINAMVKAHHGIHTNNASVVDTEDSDTEDQIMNKKKDKKEDLDLAFYNNFNKENLQEISPELVGKVNKLRSLGPDIIGGVKPKPSKTRTASDTLQRAVDKIRFGSKVGSVPVKEESLTDQEVKEDLRKWFSKTDPEGGWKRLNSKGEVIGPCAREPGEAKPKCMSNEKRAKLSKSERAAAVRAKRKHDPNPERKGEPINVSNFGKGKISEDKGWFERTAKQYSKKLNISLERGKKIAGSIMQKMKEETEEIPEAKNWAQQAAIAIAMQKAKKRPKNEEVEHLEEKNIPTNPALWSRAKALAKSKFDVYPSAYANGWAAKWYKSKGGGWKSEG
jgi:polyhydroxyalkanoate synthesis regulator phasin